MFLKRFLVMMVGVLLFIGAFLLYFHLSAAHLEEVFRNERAKYGVDDTVLTLNEASPPAPVALNQPAAEAPAQASVAPAESQPEPVAGAPADASSLKVAAPSPDQTTIIAPPDSGSTTDPVPSPDMTPSPTVVPSPDVAPAPDTNGAPMVPPSSGYLRPRFPVVAFLTAALRPVSATHHLAAIATAQTNAPAPVSATAASPVPAPTASAQAAVSASPSKPASLAPAHAAASGGRAIVLGYHQFTGPGVPSKNIYSMSQDVFISEMKYLHDNGFNVVPLSDVVAFVKHQKTLPPNAVAITIDDGYKSALNYAAPVLKEYGYPWTYFVYPAFITKTEGKGAASWPDLLELDREGVDVECHSMTHPILTSHRQKFHGPTHSLSPTEYDAFLTDETSTSKALLEQNLGKKIKYFAYPYGAYNKAVEAKAIGAGYDAIFTVADNPVHVTTDVHSIGRYIITKPVERAFASYLHQGALSLAQVDPAPGSTTSNPQPVITAVLGFTGDPASLETEVRDFGIVRHDFDPATSTVRLYLPRPLIQPEVLVSIRAKDEQTGQTMVANWHFNYEPVGGTPAPVHEPMPATTTSGNGESKPMPPIEPAPKSVGAPASTNAAPAGGTTNP